MNIAIFIVCLCVLCSNVFIFGVLFGFKHKTKKRPTQTKTLTESEIYEIKREQKELENFMNYDGKPQEVIKG